MIPSPSWEVFSPWLPKLFCGSFCTILSSCFEIFCSYAKVTSSNHIWHVWCNVKYIIRFFMINRLNAAASSGLAELLKSWVHQSTCFTVVHTCRAPVIRQMPWEMPLKNVCSWPIGSLHNCGTDDRYLVRKEKHSLLISLNMTPYLHEPSLTWIESDWRPSTPRQWKLSRDTCS